MMRRHYHHHHIHRESDGSPEARTSTGMGWGGGGRYQPLAVHEPVPSTHLVESFAAFGRKVDEAKSILTAPVPRTFPRPFADRVQDFRGALEAHIVSRTADERTQHRQAASQWGQSAGTGTVTDSDVAAGLDINPFGITIKRTSTFVFVQSSFDQFNNAMLSEFYHPLEIRFHGERMTDSLAKGQNGGVKREWFSMIMPAITNQAYALFSTDIANENRLSPSHLAVAQGSEAVQFFKFTGMLMGKALMESVTVPATFTRFIFKVLLNEAPHVSDIVSGDPELAAQLMQLEEEPDVSENNIPFSLSVDTFGEVKEVELMPGGANIQVTNDNRLEFIRLCAQHRLVGATEPYILALRDAFHSLVPARLLGDFTPEELEIMICGQPIIDIEDWKTHTVYTNGFTADSPTAVWFFEVLQEMVEVGKQLVFFFATGSRTPPALGFRYLPGGALNEIKPFELRRSESGIPPNGNTTTNANVDADGTSSPSSSVPAPVSAVGVPLPVLLPVAHTASNTLELPEYTSKQQLMESLLLALAKVNDKFTVG